MRESMDPEIGSEMACHWQMLTLGQKWVTRFGSDAEGGVMYVVGNSSQHFAAEICNHRPSIDAAIGLWNCVGSKE